MSLGRIIVLNSFFSCFKENDKIERRMIVDSKAELFAFFYNQYIK